MSVFATRLANSMVYRFGRKIYMFARCEIANDIRSNGELFLQKQLVSHWRRTAPLEPFIAIDVGANIGEWTFALLQNFDQEETGRIFITCFEPAPATALVLEQNVKRHPLGARVSVERAAASSSNGTIDFFQVGDLAGTNSVYEVEASYNTTSKIVVPRKTLDGCCDRFGRAVLSLVKVDAEGHDMEVIRGARTLLRAGRISALQFEYNYRWVFGRNYLRDVFCEIEGLPYRVGKLVRDSIVVYERWHHELEKFFEGNYVVIREDVLPYIPHRIATWDASNALTVSRLLHTTG